MLMKVERYGDIHQFVSAVRVELSPGRTAVDAVRAVFPKDCKTGAPELRTMQIIDEAEKLARGVYSGAIGYFAISGAANVSVATVFEAR